MVGPMGFLITGLSSGLYVALLATGFHLVHLPTRILFIGLAAAYTIAPYVFASLQRAGWSGLASAIAGIGAATLLSVACEFANHGPLTNRRASEGAHLISSLGIYIVIVQVTALIWGPEAKRLAGPASSLFQLGEYVMTRTQGVGIFLSLLTLAGYFAWLRSTNAGLLFRALADNSTALALLGYSIKRLRLFAFALAGFLAGIAAILMAMEIGYDPYFGLSVLLLAIVATIIGGQRSFAGPLLGALLLGMLRAHVVQWLSGQWQEAAGFVLLAVFLVVRPQGITGSRGRLEATS